MKKENLINNLVSVLTEKELKTAIKEIIEDGETGFICEGYVRSIAKQISNITGQNTSLNLINSEILLLREAANRYLNQ